MSSYEAVIAEQPARPQRPEAAAAPPQPTPGEAGKPRRRRPLLVLLVAIVLTAVVIGGVLWWLQARQYESTEDAFIDTHVISIAPQVAGSVARVLVNDNQEVKRGQVLFEIDPTSLDVTLDQAEANQANSESGLAQARAQRAVTQANAEQARALVGVAEANATNAATQLKRDQALLARHFASQQQFDNDAASARSTAANLIAAQKTQASAEAQLAVNASQIDAAKAGVRSASAQTAQARLNLSYAKIVAPEAGHIAQMTLAPGDYVQVGQDLMALVPLQVWVTANFKETELDLMRVGQQVEIHIDAYPDKTFRGHVQSFQRGSGAAFALLPPENATGNYVKVVQRVPVKILFDDPPEPSRPLGPGMSVEPSVKVR